MAYLTLTSQSLDGAATTARNDYIQTQMNAGTTDGIITTVSRVGVTDGSGDLLSLAQRSWSTNDAATAFISFINTLSPAPAYAQVVTTL